MLVPLKDQNCKKKAEDCVLSSLTATEIHNTEMIAAQKGQRDSFHLDIEALRANKRLPARSRLSAINPYVDEAEYLRVSGRLRKAPVCEETWLSFDSGSKARDNASNFNAQSPRTF